MSNENTISRRRIIGADLPLINANKLREFVRVVLKAPPCDYEFRLIIDFRGQLRSVCIDGDWYTTRKMASSPRVRDDDQMISLVEVVIEEPQ